MTSPSHPSSPPAGKRWWHWARRLLAVGCALAVLIVWPLSGFYTVATDEQGVVTRFGKLVRKGVKPGLHYALPWPIDRVGTPRTTDVKLINVGFTV